MNNLPVPPAAAFVLAIAVLALVLFVGGWITFGGGPWDRFHTVLEAWVTVMRR